MSGRGKLHELSCARAWACIHQRLDGDPLDAVSLEWLEAHVADCDECRAGAAELSRIQQTLRAVPTIPLPDQALQEVWSQTSRARRRGYRSAWHAVAAAAVLALVFVGAWQITQEPLVEPEPTPEEIARAAVEARFALRMAGTALRKSENAALHGVLNERVSPAMQRIPLLGPASRDGGSNDDGEGDV